MCIKKPPLGLKPKRIVDELRIEEIKRALDRYLQEYTQIPIEWIEEYNSLSLTLTQVDAKDS